MAAQRPPITSGWLLAALSGAAGVGLTRVFAGSEWLLPVLAVAIAPHAIVIVVRARWATELVAGALALLGIAVVGAIVHPSTTTLGLPSLHTLRELSRSFAESAEVLSGAVTPVDPSGDALQLAVFALWIAAGVAALLHARGVVLGAIAPSLVLFVAIGALGEGSWLATTGIYGLVIGLYLLASHQEEVQARRTWFHAKRATRPRVVSGGAVAAILVVVAALGAGQLLPGARSDAWFDYRSLGEGSGDGTWRTVTPLVEIRGQLQQDEEIELFTVRADAASYWRLVALDRFDGEVWGLEGDAPDAGEQLPAAHSPAESRRLVQEITLGPLATRWLPAAYQPRAVSLDGARVIPESLTLLADGDLDAGTTYTVVSDIPTPSAAELNVSPLVRDPSFARYLELPDDFPDRVRDLASAVAGGRRPYDAAISLQRHLRDNFTYDLDGPDGHSEDALVDFLFESRRGFCEQFSAAFAAMGRAIGLPTRVAVGFTSGTRDTDGIYRVTNLEAHSWPEVFLAGVGWTAFEPTPGRFEPTPGDPTGTGALAPDEQAPPATTAPPATATTTPVTTAPTGGTAPSPDDVTVGGESGATTERSTVRSVAEAFVALLALAALAAAGAGLAVWGAKLRLRRVRRHDDDTRQRVFGAWHEALDRLGEAGVAIRPSATPTEFALRHAPAHGAGAAGPALMELASLQTAALFAAESPAADDADRAWTEVAAIRAALRQGTTRGQRVSRALDPRPLRARITSSAR